MRYFLFISCIFCLSLSKTQAIDKSEMVESYPKKGLVLQIDSARMASSISFGVTSGLNGKNIFCDPDDFSFMVSGHLHGSSNSESGMPAASLMANLDLLNHKNSAFLICLGDLFLNVGRDHGNYEKYLFNKLDMPLFNAVGNHDIDNEYYGSHYGPTYFSYDIGGSRFLILDTEIDNGDLVGDQLEMVKNSLEDLKGIRNVFVFMHRTLWAEDDEELSALFPDNTKSATGTNFGSDVFPIIENASKGAEIYLFSGSLGGAAPASFLYHPYDDNITFIATAIRDLPRDAVLAVRSRKGKISFETVSLNSNKVLALEKYTVDWWKKHQLQKPGFNWKLIPLYIWQMATHRYFWYGIGYSLLGILFIWLIVSIKKKRRAAKT